MLNWIPLDQIEQLDEIVVRSQHQPCVIYKHSSRCSLSMIALYRLESTWYFPEGEVAAYFLDVIAQRALSQAVAKRFEVHHESPQLLLIQNGVCTFDASHLDISMEELRESLGSAA